MRQVLEEGTETYLLSPAEAAHKSQDKQAGTDRKAEARRAELALKEGRMLVVSLLNMRWG